MLCGYMLIQYTALVYNQIVTYNNNIAGIGVTTNLTWDSTFSFTWLSF